MPKTVNGLAFLTGNDKLYYGDFRDPEIQAWSNITFLDNYWEDRAGVGRGTGGGIVTTVEVSTDGGTT